MKKFAKKLFTILASILMVVCCFSAVACEDIKKIEINFSVYNFEEEIVEERSITVKLYRHLAPKTVDSIINNVKEKAYYNGVTPYIISEVQTDENAGEYYDKRVLMGDLIYQNGSFAQNPISVDSVHGEFYYNGHEGSDLVNEEGAIGLWRTKYASEPYSSNAGANTGKATIYMPTTRISSMDKSFCVFGKFDITKQENAETWNLIKNNMGSSNSEFYVIYYTGTYDGYNSVNNGLEFHCVTEEEYENMDKTNVFKPSGEEYSCYFPTIIKASFYNDADGVKTPAVTIKSVKVK